MNKQRLLFIILVLNYFSLYAQRQDRASQSIGVNRNTTYVNMTPEQLVKNVFIKPDPNVLIENVRIRALGWNGTSTPTKVYGDTTGIGYFNKEDSNFPLEEGLIISTGNVLNAEGPNKTGVGLGTPRRQALNYIGDADLEKLINTSYSRINNVTSIEFDFTALSTSVQFKYIFASEEYPVYANNQYNDVFGFFIHKIGDESTKENIAFLPLTQTNSSIVSINNVNDGAYTDYTWTSQSGITGTWGGHPRIQPRNGTYFVRQPSGSKATEFNGYVYDRVEDKPLEAEYNKLVPGKKYHIKIIVGNSATCFPG